jgi:SAM-dependent methyltransferase
MTHTPETKNHYFGFLADWYDRLLVNEDLDIKYYIQAVGNNPQSLLELACGTGRLMIPLIKAGHELDGIDISPQMLKICSDILNSENLNANLYEQDIINFNVDKRYDTIFISGGSFCMISDFEEAYTCLCSILYHLQPGGRFLLDIFNPLDSYKENDPDQPKIIRTAEDGEEKIVCYSVTEYDIQEQIMEGSYKYELFKSGKLQEEIEDEFKMRWYGKYEFKLLLEKAGFRNITIEPHSIMSSHSGTLVYTAQKPK